jgi:hypothetical protein
VVIGDGADFVSIAGKYVEPAPADLAVYLQGDRGVAPR